MSLYYECKTELQHLFGEVTDLYSETQSLTGSIENVSSFGLDGLEIKSEWQGIDKKFKRLLLRIKYKAEELGHLSQQGIFPKDQAEDINDLWHSILAKMKAAGAVIQDAVNILRSKNFLVDVILWLEELWESIVAALKFAGKVIIQGTFIMLGGNENHQSLPPV